MYGWFMLDAIDNPRITESDGDGLLFHKVDPETVGQYTGLQDKNGVKIFEGDIVQFLPTQNLKPYRVQLKDIAKVTCKIGCWLLVFGDNGGDEYLYDWHTDIEVIGNIHDNPELVEREDKKQ